MKSCLTCPARNPNCLFLPLSQSELNGVLIYNIIHHGDHARFSSNLLPMSALGNGFSWGSGLTGGADSSSSGGGSSASSSAASSLVASTASSSLVASVSGSGSTASKSRCFNTRFLVKGKRKKTSESEMETNNNSGVGGADDEEDDEDFDFALDDSGYAASSSIGQGVGDAVYENMQVS